MPSWRQQLFQQADVHLSRPGHPTPSFHRRALQVSAYVGKSQRAHSSHVGTTTAKVVLVCMGCRGTKAAPPAPACIIHSSKLTSSHFRCMTSVWVMQSLMEKKGGRLKNLGEKQTNKKITICCLKVQGLFPLLFLRATALPLTEVIGRKPKSLREGPATKRAIMQPQPSLKPAAGRAQVLSFRDLHRHGEGGQHSQGKMSAS